MKNIYFFVFLIFIFACTKEEIVPDNFLFKNTDSNYPTSFKKLSPKEQQLKQAEFEQGQISFSLIDSFGFVGWSYEDDFDVRKQLHNQFFTDVDELIFMSKKYIVEKSKFTGVNNSAQLAPEKIMARFQDYGGEYNQPDSLTFNSLYIDFGNQKIEGLEVINSLLTCTATMNGVHRIFGHWFPVAYIPAVDKVSVELAKSTLVGRVLTSSDGWGNKLTHTIAEHDLDENRKVIYPFINGNKLELRVCREFKSSHWWILMDSTTGEILLEADTAFYLF